jgi:hypothetical protein
LNEINSDDKKNRRRKETGYTHRARVKGTASLGFDGARARAATDDNCKLARHAQEMEAMRRCARAGGAELRGRSVQRSATTDARVLQSLSPTGFLHAVMRRRP